MLRAPRPGLRAGFLSGASRFVASGIDAMRTLEISFYKYLNSCLMLLNAVPSTGSTPNASRFLGVRLGAEEEEKLEAFRQARGFSSRSDAVRALVRDAATDRSGAVEIPPTVREELIGLVENGYARDLGEAVRLSIELGLADLVRLHVDRLGQLRGHARELAERRRGRNRLDREGRELLRR